MDSGKRSRVPPKEPAVRRGVTPAKTKKVDETKAAKDSKPEKPKLTVEQQLMIINRIETGNYQRGVGLKQFYEEFQNVPTTSKACSKNLMKEFGDLATGCDGDMDKGPSSVGNKDFVDQVQDSMRKLNLDTEEDEDYKALPEYIKQIDRTIVYYEMMRRKLTRMAEMQADELIEQHCPLDKISTFLVKLDACTAILEKFNKKTPAERMRLFELYKKDSKKEKTSAIHCSIETQTEFVVSINKIKDLVEALDHITIPGAEKDFSKELDIMSTLVENIDSRLQMMERLQKESKFSIEKAETVELYSPLINSAIESSHEETSTFNLSNL